MAIITYPSTHPLLAELHRLARDLCATNRHPPLEPPLRHIVAPGMVFFPETGPSLRDQHWLRHAFRYCASIGAPIAEDFTLTPLLLPKAEEEDFLAPCLNERLKIKPDAVWVCHIFDAKKEERYWKNLIKTQRGKQRKQAQRSLRNCQERQKTPGFQTSRYYKHPLDWHRAASTLDVRLIIAFVYGDEISAANFCGPGYHAVLPKKVACDLAGKGEYYAEIYDLEPVLREDLAAQLIRHGGLTRAALQS